MTPCLGQSCSFGLLCVSFVGVCQIFVRVLLSLLVLVGWGVGGGRMWDVIVLIPDHCLSIYFH